MWCEIYKDFTCKSSVAAEAIGMYLQLKRSIGLNYLQPHTDNDTIRNVITGKVLVGLTEKDTKFWLGTWTECPRQVPHEELSFVDGLLRNPKVMKHIGNFGAEKFITHDVVKQWVPNLKGYPIFSIMPGKRCIIGTTNCLLSLFYSYLVCYIKSDGTIM